jgi:hypothetical protein
MISSSRIEELKQITSREEWQAAIWNELQDKTYSGLLALYQQCEKHGMPIHPALWYCPICNEIWKHCPHPLVPYWGLEAAYPSWEDRPWKDSAGTAFETGGKLVFRKP